MVNLDFNSEKGISNILESVCEQASPPSEYRSRLLQELKHAVMVQKAPRPLRGIADWTIITAVIISTIIAYSLGYRSM